MWRLLVYATVILFLSVAHSQVTIQGLAISADEVERNLEKKQITLSGNISITYNGQTIIADNAVIDLPVSKITVKGHMIMRSEQAFAQGQDLEYNYKTETAKFHNGFIQSGQVIFEGDVIEKIGPNEYLATNASYSACASCPPAWSFSGKEIHATLGGYASIKLPVLRISDFPVFFLPKILVPLKSDRQSGLLVPGWEKSGDGGLALSQSYFWAISRSQDATFTLKNYELRGLKLLTEYRYVFDENSKGNLDFSLLKDQVFQKQRGFSQAINRWQFTYKHIYELPESYIQRADLKFTSDIFYPKDFPEEIIGSGDPALESRLSLTKTWENQFASAEAVYFTNLLKDDPLAKNSDAVHKFPEINYSLTERQLGNSGFYFRFDSQFTHFARNNQSYDDVSTGTVPTAGDGSFDPDKDILRSGARIDVLPSVSYPLNFMNRIDILPKITYRQTHYTFFANAIHDRYDNRAIRQYLQLDLSLKTQYNRIFKGFQLFDDETQSQTLYKHKIEPEFAISNIPWKERPDHVFFGNFVGKKFDRINDPISENDFYDHTALKAGSGKVQFDYEDRLFDLKVIKLGLTNRLVRKKWIGDGPQYKNIATFSVFQYYDLNESENSSTNPKPLSALHGLLDLRLDDLETNSTAKYYPYAGVTDLATRIRFVNPFGNFLELSYNRTNQMDDNYILIEDGLNETYGLGSGYASHGFNFLGEIKYSNITHEIQSWGYKVEIEPAGDCWALIFFHEQPFSSDPKFRFDFSFDFGGGK